MTIAGGHYFAPVNQNVDSIIYKSSRGHINLFVKSVGFTNLDTLYTYRYPAFSLKDTPIFDTLVLPHNGLFRDFYISNERNRGAIAYRINRGGLERFYNYTLKEFDVKNIDGLQLHYFNITGDPYKDTTTLVLRK